MLTYDIAIIIRKRAHIFSLLCLLSPLHQPSVAGQDVRSFLPLTSLYSPLLVSLDIIQSPNSASSDIACVKAMSQLSTLMR